MKKRRKVVANLIMFFYAIGLNVVVTNANEEMQYIVPLLLDASGGLGIDELIVQDVDCLNDNCFTVVVLPDTQHYSMMNEGTYRKQTRWIVDNKDRLNVKFVIHVGDIVQHEKTDNEWRVAEAAHSLLFREDTNPYSIPYSMALGNHDYPEDGRNLVLGNPTDYYNTKRDSTRFNKYFGRNSSSEYLGFSPRYKELYAYYTEDKIENTKGGPDIWRWGHLGSNHENNYHLFESDEGLKFMVISLDFAPEKDALCWAEKLIRKYNDRRVIIVTHCYQKGGTGSDSNELCTSCSDTLVGSSGDDVWYELVERYDNIFMVLSGHKIDSEYRAHLRIDGNSTVHEIMSDYVDETMRQWNGFHWTNKEHGQGWLRTLTFYPDSDEIKVIATSVLGKTSLTAKIDDPPYTNRYPHNPKILPHSFLIPYQMDTDFSSSYQAIKSNTFSDRTVNPDGRDSQKYPTIAMGKDWHVVVWDNEESGSIEMRAFDNSGCPCPFERTLPTEENNDTLPLSIIVTEDGKSPSVAISEDDEIVVAWEDGGNIYAKKYYIEKGKMEDGSYHYIEDYFENEKIIVVNSEGEDQSENPDVKFDGKGNFIVTWNHKQRGDDGGGFIFAARMNKQGEKRGNGDLIINYPKENGRTLHPDIAVNDKGDFVVVWQDDSNNGNGYYDIHAARFNADGTKVTYPEKPDQDILVNESIANSQKFPKIALFPDDSFVVTWQGRGTHNNQIHATRFAPTAIDNVEGDFTVNDEPSGSQEVPDIAALPGNSFVITWQDYPNDSDRCEHCYQDILATFFTSDLNKVDLGVKKKKGDDFLVNEIQNGAHKLPVVAANSLGNFVIAWQDDSNYPAGGQYSSNDAVYDIVSRGFEIEDNEPPEINCPTDIIRKVNDAGYCGAIVNYVLPTATDNFGPPTVQLKDGRGSGEFFDVGTWHETYIAIDSAGNESSECTISIEITDNEPPAIHLSNDRETLWPPNHKSFNLSLDKYIDTVDDNCSDLSWKNVIIKNASSDEEQNSSGDGNTNDDILISEDCQSVNLLAERKGNGNGRVYTVNLGVVDAAANLGVEEIKVEVPHDQGKGYEVVDDGAVHIVEGCAI